ncbi:MAG: glycosyltransferase [Cyanobacteria bacterium P01_G01_bin.67]
MTHFGIICPAESGHLNTFFPLAQELKQRGHRLSFITIIDGQQKILAAGFEAQVIGADLFPLGKLKERFIELGQLNGLAALKFTINLIKDTATILLRDAPQIIRDQGIEALLVDQTLREGGSVAEFMGIPFITICSAVVLNRDPEVPPFNTAWEYSSTWQSRLRNKLGYKLLSRVTKPISETIGEYRQARNLPLHSTVNDAYSALAQITHQPQEFEFPRQNLPPYFHFTSPFHSEANREPVAFPWEKLTGQPLIYASMGTLQNRLTEIFTTITSACAELDAQLVITMGGADIPESLQNLPGNPLIVSYAPQLQLLPQVALTITHGGMNTTLECLTYGVPMVAIPIANDQPGIASRIAWSGVGEMIPLKKLNTENLQQAIKQVLTEDGYKKNALRLQEAIKQGGGASRAADIIEQAVATGKPVLA